MDGFAEGDEAGDKEKGDKDGHERKRGFSPTYADRGRGHGEGTYAHDDEQEGEKYPSHFWGGIGYRILMLFLGTLAPVVVEFICGGFFGMASHPVGVPQDKGDADDGEQYPAEKTVFEAGEDGDVGNALGNAYRERVEHGPCKAHMGSNIAHAYTYDGVIAHGDGKRDEDDDKGDGLFAHAEDGTEKTEHDHDECDDDVLHP